MSNLLLAMGDSRISPDYAGDKHPDIQESFGEVSCNIFLCKSPIVDYFWHGHCNMALNLLLVSRQGCLFEL